MDAVRREHVIEATSCGGIVVYRGKILLLYKDYKNHYDGWVLPKGTMEPGENEMQTALREVKEETGVDARIVDYIGKSGYTFRVPEGVVNKTVHWFLMEADSYFSHPQRQEYFFDSGYYKYHEAIHLIRFQNEREILQKGYALFQERKKRKQRREQSR